MSVPEQAVLDFGRRPALNVVKDGARVEVGFEELFCPAAYRELYAVTYVSSPAFFFSVAERFDVVRLIMGIEDREKLEPFGDCLKHWLEPGKQVELWNSISEAAREKIVNGDIVVRFPRPGSPVHSKLYLLKGPGGTRVAVGSANFTRAAFCEGSQYEELLVFDDSPLFDVYMERFRELEGVTQDWVSDELKRPERGLTVVVADPELLSRIALSGLGKVAGLVVTGEQMAAIRERPALAEKERASEESYVKLFEVVTEKPRKGSGYRVVEPARIEKKKLNAFRVAVSGTQKGSLEKDNRVGLYYRDSDALLLRQDTAGGRPDVLVPFSGPVPLEAVKRNLLALNEFVGSYELCTHQRDPGTCARVFEVLLYAFVSPYVWKMRDHYAASLGQDSARANLPSFLFVYGVSMSGKTTLFEVLGRLLGTCERPMSYEEVKEYLRDYFWSENLAPVLVDEVPERFMSSTSEKRGERLIKAVSNDLRGKHPVMIGASNSDRFAIPPQVQRRVYFLRVSSTFVQSDETRSRLNSAVSEMDTALFRDFTYRLAGRIRDGAEFYSGLDILSAARDIFREYYAACGLELPGWFPRSPVDDYRERGRSYWLHAYRTRRSAFRDVKDGRLVVNLDELVGSKEQDRSFVVDLLPPECLTDRTANMLQLKKDLFCSFIGVPRSALFGRLGQLLAPRG